MGRERGLKEFLDELVAAGELGSAAVSARTVRSLQPLEVQRDHSVLELGVGSGVTTAVLAETVGHGGLVTTVDTDIDRVVLARRRLVRHYGHVSVFHGEAAAGASRYAPFDRVLAHGDIKLGRLPYAWVEQAEPRALILAPVQPGFLVRFTVHDDGTATGRPVLVQPGPVEARWQLRWDEREAIQSVTHTQPWALLENPGPRWALAVAVPSYEYEVAGENPRLAWLRDPFTSSWASVAPGKGAYVVHQTGPRRLWDETEAAYRRWIRCGTPEPRDWEWVVSRERQNVRLRPEIL
ncbi:methyltransferase domain-containing protein [Amycolatopsis magusensis]|uniref:methyltransferase domain-containing protein n=1 Tax=Amycolatopsis magusensis TaxID=882444 RepID=UPI0037BCDC42